MHELSLAQELIHQVGEAAAREKASRITRIVVVIGSLSGVEPDAFRFAFPFAAEDTLAADAELVIETVQAGARCHACNCCFTPDPPLMTCPDCGSDRIRIEGGRDFLIRSIELEQNS